MFCNNSDNQFPVVECPVAFLLPELNALENPPSFTPPTVVEYGSTLTMTCNVPGEGTFTRTRTCVYDFEKEEYALVGDKLECGCK